MADVIGPTFPVSDTPPLLARAMARMTDDLDAGARKGWRTVYRALRRADRMLHVTPQIAAAYSAALKSPLRKGVQGWVDAEARLHQFPVVYAGARRGLLLIDGGLARAAEAVKL